MTAISPKSSRALDLRLIAGLGFCTVLAATSIYAGIILGARDSDYQAGRINADMPFFFSHSDWNWMKVWLATMVGLVAAAFYGIAVKRLRLLVIATFAFCVSVPVWPITSHFSKPGHERYFDGLKEWTASNIDVSAIREWQTK